MKQFEYLAPRSLSEALERVAERPEAAPLAGGTDLLPEVKAGERSIAALLSLKRVPELHRTTHDETLVLGAAATVGRIAADPRIRREFAALAHGAGLIGSVQIRNVATVGGNLCHGAPSADTAPPLLALGAQAVLVSARGERTLPLEAFFLGPGRTALQPGELLKEIVVLQPAARSGSCYLRHTPRACMDLAVVGVAAALTLDGEGRITAARLALGAVAPVPLRATAAEALLIGQLPSDALWQEAGAAAARECRPIDDLRASAEYRRHLVEVLTQRALRGALDSARLSKEA
jgi:CO/xanthine dehydrogenase FAD-binding subunit